MDMRIALGHIDRYEDSIGQFAKQLGLSSVQFHNPTNLLSDVTDGWTPALVKALIDRCNRLGLSVEGFENVPLHMFADIVVGGPDRTKQLDRYLAVIETLGAVGVPYLGYHWMAGYVWRTDMRAKGRGGALVTSFDLEQARQRGNALAAHRLSSATTPKLSTEDLWEHHERFLSEALPVAQSAGVTLALHPDDPPVEESLGGVPRIFTSLAALKRASDQAHGSRAWGLNLCLGTISEMGGQSAVDEAIAHFGFRQQIAYVHFRDVTGDARRFAECFLGEGNLDPLRTFAALDQVGFTSFVIDDHVPAMIGDPDTWGDISPEAYITKGRAYAIAYLQASLRAACNLNAGSRRS